MNFLINDTTTTAQLSALGFAVDRAQVDGLWCWTLFDPETGEDLPWVGAGGFATEQQAWGAADAERAKCVQLGWSPQAWNKGQ